MIGTHTYRVCLSHTFSTGLCRCRGRRCCSVSVSSSEEGWLLPGTDTHWLCPGYPAPLGGGGGRREGEEEGGKEGKRGEGGRESAKEGRREGRRDGGREARVKERERRERWRRRGIEGRRPGESYLRPSIWELVGPTSFALGG